MAERPARAAPKRTAIVLGRDAARTGATQAYVSLPPEGLRVGWRSSTTLPARLSFHHIGRAVLLLMGTEALAQSNDLLYEHTDLNE
ncbi:hypothetical protein NDU88_005675 [Pleurodeles waltl]|uniref:Uncharacterized protein n=1 Tax=Pleurodeles waltl TaxID=8319 RepID=A0AAV7PG45_PLEWA|nr:hypothetical protein NDU88_005675 [Pleurodeles waltl]